ncbi:MAG: D-alanyl-D-alanine carboxypeptidase/D-alanyl-D-alanine-endopeptidase [Chlamydiia bacterium]|nr:D-alanyl-D-alanine carboxypeptidase/D-alanyl-D-alanine-endopeptidase [Chlamydiia bacterium]
MNMLIAFLYIKVRVASCQIKDSQGVCMLPRIILTWIIASSLSFSIPLGCSPTDRVIQSDDYYGKYLQLQLDKVIQKQIGSAHIGIEVVSLATRSPIYQKNSSKLFIPASCLKIFTGSSCLAFLGPDYRFTTGVWTDGVIKNKRLIGNIYLKGGGDPSLDEKGLQALALQIKGLGIEKIVGSLFVDTSDFDSIQKGPGWMWDDGPEYWNCPVSALTVNHGCVELLMEPSIGINQAPKIILQPNTAFVKCHNLAQTCDGADGQIAIERRSDQEKNSLYVTGLIPSKSQPMLYRVSLEDPHLYAGALFLDTLRNCGIFCPKGIEQKKIPEKARLLVEHRSDCLEILVHKMMKESDNLYAECFFKKIGQLCFGGEGTWRLAADAVKKLIATKGLNTSQMALLDGSGMSRYNLISPRQLVEFLLITRDDPVVFKPFINSLPVSGIDGTLKFTMDDPELVGKIRAKTGSMTGVRCLSGYVITTSGEELVVSIMMNGVIDKSVALKLEKEICKILVGYKKQ